MNVAGSYSHAFIWNNYDKTIELMQSNTMNDVWHQQNTFVFQWGKKCQSVSNEQFEKYLTRFSAEKGLKCKILNVKICSIFMINNTLNIPKVV